jgi:hypothetical protein
MIGVGPTLLWGWAKGTRRTDDGSTVFDPEAQTRRELAEVRTPMTDDDYLVHGSEFMVQGKYPIIVLKP